MSKNKNNNYNQNKNKEENMVTVENQAEATTPNASPMQVPFELKEENGMLVQGETLEQKQQEAETTAEVASVVEQEVEQESVEEAPETSPMEEENTTENETVEEEEQEEDSVETEAPKTRRLIVTKTGKFTNAEVQAKLKQVGLTSAVDKDGKIILAHVTDETSEHAVRPFIKRVVAAGFKAEIR